MEVAISGSSGLIGQALSTTLAQRGHRPIALVRRSPRAGADEVQWDPAKGELDGAALEGLDAVVNLSGASLFGDRWSTAYKRVLVESRVNSSKCLAQTLSRLRTPPPTFLTASGTTYYGSADDAVLTESSPPGSNFLARMCVAWEEATNSAREAGIRTVPLRMGMVLSPVGGGLEDIVKPFRMGMGGKMGSGRQYTPWITIDDLTEAMLFALEHGELEGPVNLTVPTPVTNADFARAIGRALGRPSLLPTPRFLLALALGKERAENLLLASLRVVPEKLTTHGFRFRHGEAEPALRSLLAPAAQPNLQRNPA
ncbi:MAG: TIGR01777 family oxidoreductase [Myxococcota bacterium]